MAYITKARSIGKTRKNILQGLRELLVSQGANPKEIKDGFITVGYIANSIVRTYKLNIWEGHIGLSQKIYQQAKSLSGKIYIYINEEKKIYRIDINQNDPRLVIKGQEMIYNFSIRNLEKFNLTDMQ